MKTIRFDSEAKAEYSQAIDYYQRQRLGLGEGFYAEVEATTLQIQEDPDRWATVGQTVVRKCLLNRFPYAIIYLDLPKTIQIVAVANLKRRPLYWQDRI